MITEELFKERVLYLDLNFNVKCEPQYIKFIYQSTANRFDDDDVKYGFTEMFKITKKEWNDLYGYGGKPAVADWVNFFSLKRKHEIKAIEDKKFMVAIENAKNGVKPVKQIEVDNSVPAKEIEVLIKNIGNREY